MKLEKVSHNPHTIINFCVQPTIEHPWRMRKNLWSYFPQTLLWYLDVHLALEGFGLQPVAHEHYEFQTYVLFGHNCINNKWDTAFVGNWNRVILRGRWEFYYRNTNAHTRWPPALRAGAAKHDGGDSLFCISFLRRIKEVPIHASIGGSVEEFSPSLRETRVRFQANAHASSTLVRLPSLPFFLKDSLIFIFFVQPLVLTWWN